MLPTPFYATIDIYSVLVSTPLLIINIFILKYMISAYQPGHISLKRILYVVYLSSPRIIGMLVPIIACIGRKVVNH